MRNRTTELFVTSNLGIDILYSHFYHVLNQNGGYDLFICPSEYKITIIAKPAISIGERTKMAMCVKFFKVLGFNNQYCMHFNRLSGDCITFCANFNLIKDLLNGEAKETQFTNTLSTVDS